QCSAGTQAGHQFTLQSTTALNVESLVDSFVRDPHGLILREVNFQPMGDLLRTPAFHPSTIPTMWLVPPLPPSFHRSVDHLSIGCDDLSCQSVLDIVPQLRVTHQFCCLGAFGEDF